MITSFGEWKLDALPMARHRTVFLAGVQIADSSRDSGRVRQPLLTDRQRSWRASRRLPFVVNLDAVAEDDGVRDLHHRSPRSENSDTTPAAVFQFFS